MLLKKQAAVAEGLEQDLSQAFSDDATAILSPAQFKPACIRQESGIPGRPGGTDCMIRESDSSAVDQSASDIPEVTSIDIQDT